jgi:adenine/guanine/hypoxanthine permease
VIKTTASGNRWAAAGDVNAFFGLMLDNVAGLVLVVALLVEAFQFPAAFVLQRMVPGTAIGVLIGDLCFFLLALRLSRRTGNANVTAMPLGLDTPSIFGTALFIVGPAFAAAKQTLAVDQAAVHAWHIGIVCLFLSGCIKLLFAFFAHTIRRWVPRAGLLGSLAAIALVLISFLPLMDIFAQPTVGIVSLLVVLVTLSGRIAVPGRIPGTLAGLIVGGAIYYAMRSIGWIHPQGVPFDARDGLFPTQWLDAWTFQWWQAIGEAVPYLPIALPLALATVVGGIDCTESAAAVGDEYPTGQVIGVEAIATILAACCGGITQTTPYIGHPAYKAMGGRAAYALATALFIGGAGVIGGCGYFYQWIPRPAVYPVLIFVGLEITAQSFLATPKRHYPAVALACVPALAFLSVYFANQVLGDPALASASITTTQLINADLREKLATANLLASGFLLTSLLWSSALALAIDRRLRAAATCFLVAAGLTSFGWMHSPLPGNALFVPFSVPGLSPKCILPEVHQPALWRLISGYALAAALLWGWSFFARTADGSTNYHEPDDDHPPHPTD